MLRKRLMMTALAVALGTATTLTIAQPAQAERSEACTSAIYGTRVSYHMYTWYNVFCGSSCPETANYWNQTLEYSDRMTSDC
jgi:hypothetical protein